jgi:hypothetical protein
LASVSGEKSGSVKMSSGMFGMAFLRSQKSIGVSIKGRKVGASFYRSTERVNPRAGLDPQLST